jgi:thymidylate kinase
MKVYIIEGPDNTGKSTLCEAIKNYYINQGILDTRIKIMHFSTPSGKTIMEQINNAYTEYHEAVKYIVSKSTQKSTDVLILDRSWYGEYVYGQIYRNRSANNISSIIRSVEDILINNIDPDDIKLIITNVDDMQFVINHEDGKSLSKLNTDYLKEEFDLFDEIPGISGLTNIIKLQVNKSGSSTDFENIEVLLNKVI